MISNRRGLHARASAKFVKLAEQYDAVIKVEKDGECVGATSIMGLMMLSAANGAHITLTAQGTEAEAALAALEALINNKFDEE